MMNKNIMGAMNSQQTRENIQSELIGLGYLEKHQKYKNLYGTNEKFHGIGIENEVYLEFDKKIGLTKQQFLSNRARERYSVDYNNSYHENILNQTINEYADNFFKQHEHMQIPLLMNSHSFQNGDKDGNQRTLYTKEIKKNPKYNGQKLIDFCFEKSSLIKENCSNNFVFDGDTIEFITVNFYNGKLEDVFNELNMAKKIFIDTVNSIFTEHNVFSEYGKLQIMKQNYPFATHLTNINNYGMFNNGTIHINLTLPTNLNNKGEITNKDHFINVHKKYIKYIQLVEPLLVGMYGSPDIFSQLEYITHKNKYSASSQRCSVSRYIGLGTYDTDEMKTGKMLTMKIDDINFSKNDFWWYNKFHENSAYKKLDQIGLDINFNKHYNHGVEIRFLDHMDDNKLKNVLMFLLYVGDFVLDKQNKKIVETIINPGNDEQWNFFTEDVIRNGKNAKITNNVITLYNTAFDGEFKSNNLETLYDNIFTYLEKKYQYMGVFSKRICV